MKAVGRNISLAALTIGLMSVSGCWKENMGSQPKVKPEQDSAFFANGTTARPIPQGTVARGQWRHDSVLYTGFENGKLATHFPDHWPTEQDGPFPASGPELALALQRGRLEFTIFCSMCHGQDGDGNGIVVHRGMVPPPSWHVDRLREAPVGHFFDVITSGYGAMYSYNDRVSPADRWAIVAYIRTLQMARAMPADRLTADDLAQLRQRPSAGAGSGGGS